MSDTIIPIESVITVGSLADKLQIPVTKLITELMKNGVMATVNERIDFDTAQIIVDDLGLDVKLIANNLQVDNVTLKHKSDLVVSDKAIKRPPVVAVMGHVDHGKTSLLDAIRLTHVADKEAGGITQHISAYQIDYEGRLITFLDTPGHEAFAAIREHGAHLTDIVIIVIAADDGIKPQTIEAIRFARKAEVKIIVAINKIDKEGADVARIKQQLSEQDLLIEEWGGDIVVVEVSAKTKQGIDKLLEMILLVSDVEDVKADIDVPARGLIIESHIEQGRGPIAFVLIEAGILKPSAFIVAGEAYAKIRNLETTEGKPIKEAYPATPVKITGFKKLPEFGDIFEVVKNEKEARELSTSKKSKLKQDNSMIGSSELIRMINRKNQIQKFNLIVKADVKGSLTSVIDSLKALDTEEVAVAIVGSGVGAINENDLHLAHSSGAIIYGFNVNLSTSSAQQAHRDHIVVKQYKVIYELLDDVKKELTALLQPEIIEVEQGRVIIKAIFNTAKNEIICGGLVTKGKIVLPSLAKIYRSDELIGEVELINLKRGQVNVKEVSEDELCGMSFSLLNQKITINVDDRLEFFIRQTVTRSL